MSYKPKSITITFNVEYYKVPRSTQKSIRNMLKAMSDEIDTIPISLQCVEKCIERGTLTVRAQNGEHHIDQNLRNKIAEWFKSYGERYPDTIKLSRYVYIDNTHSVAVGTNYYMPGDMPINENLRYNYEEQRIRLELAR